MAAESHYIAPRAATAASTPTGVDDHTHHVDMGNATDEESLGKGVGKGWLGDLDG